MQAGVRTLSWEDSPGGRYDSPLQHSCLENSMNRLAWRTMVQRVTKGQTQQKRVSTVQHKLINKALQTQRCRSEGRGNELGGDTKNMKLAIKYNLFTTIS